MSLVGSFTKTPVERADYEIDLGPELAGDSVADIAWVSSSPAELVVGTGANGLPAPSLVGAKATVWLGGGAPGKFYTVNANVTTTGGRVLVRGAGVQVIDDSAAPGASLARTTTSAVAFSGTNVAVGVGAFAATAAGAWMLCRRDRRLALIGAALATGGLLALGMVLYAALVGRRVAG